MCRPSGDEMQRENYDGHYQAHGLAFQYVMLPNGMTADVYGPV
ncbi:unnamed protein product [Discosporangium mesarthrocarpum]